MKKILITGVDGFLGSNLRAKCIANGIDVIDFRGDILKDSDIEENLNAIDNLDFVFHFAGISSVGDCLINKDLTVKVNVAAVKALAQKISTKFSRAVFIFPSTGQVYANSDFDLTEKSEIKPISFYAETKRQAEIELESVSREFDMKIIILRLFNHSHVSQGVNFFMPAVVNKINKTPERIVVGNLNLERDIGSVHDLMDAFVKIINIEYCSLEHYEIYNLSSYKVKKLNTIVEEICSYLKKSPQIAVDMGLIRENEPYKIIGCNLKFCKKFSWEPSRAKDEKTLVASFFEKLY